MRRVGQHGIFATDSGFNPVAEGRNPRVARKIAVNRMRQAEVRADERIDPGQVRARRGRDEQSSAAIARGDQAFQGQGVRVAQRDRAGRQRIVKIGHQETLVFDLADDVLRPALQTVALRVAGVAGARLAETNDRIGSGSIRRNRCKAVPA